MSDNSHLPQKKGVSTSWKDKCGPLKDFLDDDEVTEIMVNNAYKIFIEKNGIIKKTPAQFSRTKDLLNLMHSIAKGCGRELNKDHPLVDANLPDGSRVHLAIPPVAVDGPAMTIRKYSNKALTHTQLIEHGSFDKKIAYFLSCCVQARLNILICGGTGSGKTTLMNILSSFISPHERLLTIEDTIELKLKNDNTIRLEARGLNNNGLSISDLVRNSLRMRPDRVIVGECRGAEAFDMLNAMNTGHEGSMTTIHANSARDGLRRLETMVLMAQTDMPIKVIRSHISHALDVIIQINRSSNGTRRVVEIIEIGGMEGDTILTQDIFAYNDKKGFHHHGFVPRFIHSFQDKGINFPKDFFNDTYKFD